MNMLKRCFALTLALLLCLSCIPAAFAAEADDAVIRQDASCTLTIWKYDFTNAAKDGVWNRDSFVSTGWRESYVEEILGGTARKGETGTDNSLGNGQSSNSYAIKGVEFTYLRVAEIATFTESANDGHPEYDLSMLLYGFDRDKSAGLLSAIGLGGGGQRYENADLSDKLSPTNYYYTSDALNKALSDALASNATTVKNALESYIRTNGGIPMPLTSESGKTMARELPVGLYLLVETKVPEMVTSTVNPFFVSLPMTSVSGDGNSNSPAGGSQWNYDVAVYPKNETGIPTLEKTVREAKADTGKHGGTANLSDGFAHWATGSAGDTMEYQIVSTLPTITSQATALSVYQLYDSLDAGLSYDKKAGVTLEFFTDKDCTQKAVSWSADSGKFSVRYSDDDRHMTIDITSQGLAEINGAASNANGALYAGYSNYTLRATYSAILNTDASLVCGESGNDNTAVLTWKRSSSEYYDTLVDDTHVYTFGLDLTKEFSDKDSTAAQDAGMFQKVQFKIYNKTDDYWLTARRDDQTGIYYVTGHARDEADATVFYPVAVEGKPGHILVKGCEDDEYILTEIATANGYTLLRGKITVTISVKEDTAKQCSIYSTDALGVLQNDPNYSFDGGLDLKLANIPQKQLAHSGIAVSSKVDKNDVTMTADGESENAAAPMKVVNTQGLNLPETGDNGTWMYGSIGIVLMLLALLVIFLAKKSSRK